MRAVALSVALLFAFGLPAASALPGSGGDVSASLPAGGAGVVLFGGATQASATVMAAAFLGGANVTIAAEAVEFLDRGETRRVERAEIVVDLADAALLVANGTAQATYATPGGLGILVTGLPGMEGVDAERAIALAADETTAGVRGDGEAFLVLRGGSAVVDGDAVRTDAFHLFGAWTAAGEGAVAAFALRAGSGLDVHVAPGDDFDLEALMRRVSALQAGAEAGDAPLPAGGLDAAREAVAALAPMLNGAALIIPNGDPLEVAYQGRPDEGPRFALIRGDMALTETEGQYRVQGASAMAFDGRAFATDAPPAFGFVPVFAALLWLAAVGTIVWRVARKPPEEPQRSVGYRLAAAGLHAVALVVVFVVWDLSFKAAFGTSALTALADGASWTVIGGLAAIELVPWSLAALLFALPARIVASNVLARFGHGKRARGAAKAIGLVVLGVFGPWHALWIVNTFVLPYVPLG